MFKKIFLSFLTVSVLFVSVFARPAMAQTWYLQDFQDWHNRVYDMDNQDEIFGERYTAAQVEWVIYGLIAFLINHVVGGEVAECAFNMDESGQLTPECIDTIRGEITNLLSSSGLQTPGEGPNFSSVLAQTFGHEMSGVGYVWDKLSGFRLVPEAQAQDPGFGFDAGSAVRQIWSVVRNVTYFLLVIAIVVMAFMIMFRVKLSPQTVITVQSALPRVVITLLLITFSYAIAGFMIDLMYVVIGIIAAVFSQSGLFVYSPLAIGIAGEPLSWADMYGWFSGEIEVFTLMLLYFLIFFLVSAFALVSNILGAIFLPITGVLWFFLVVVTLVMLFILFFKIIWMLLKTFVSILLLIAAAPILILLGLFGGGGFGGWLKNLAAHLAVYPAVGVMFALSFLFLANAQPNLWIVTDFLASLIPFNPSATAFDNSPWVPPFTPFGHDLDIVWLLVSLVILTLIPNVANMIKSLIQGRPFAYGTAIAAPITGALGVATIPISQPISVTREAFRKSQVEALMEAQGGLDYLRALTGRKSRSK
jgi:hypothetical protein